MTILEVLQGDLRTSLVNGVEIGIGSIGLGMFTADGRQVGAVVRETATNILEISDGGETWSDLRMDGCVSGAPNATLRLKLETLCKSYGVQWDQKTTSIVTVVRRNGFPEAARRIGAASIAIDSWRTWISPRESGAATNRAIVCDVREIATKREWLVDEDACVPGKLSVQWHASAVLHRRSRHVALTFLDEKSKDKVLQRAAGWMLGTDIPLIFVAPDYIADDMVSDTMFTTGRAVMLPKTRPGLSRNIVEAAERVAA